MGEFGCATYIFALAVTSHPQADFKSVFKAIYANLKKYTNMLIKLYLRNFAKNVLVQVQLSLKNLSLQQM